MGNSVGDEGEEELDAIASAADAHSVEALSAASQQKLVALNKNGMECLS